MPTSSQNPDRDAYIAGVRQLADWLEQNTDVPTDCGQNFLLALLTNPAVEQFAEQRGLTVEYDKDGNAYVDVTFGPVVYHVYGYVDFTQHLAESRERAARSWAEKNGMVIEPREGGDES